MTRALSLYLDALRVCAALTVAFFHASSFPMTRSTLNFPFGVDAVIVFFVLSGFVIADVAQRRDTSLAAFWTGRLARLWSVLIPALLLTPVFDAVGRSFHPEAYEGWGVYLAFDHPEWRLLSAAVFANEVWFASIAPLSNGQVWSIAYEFAYYLLFSLGFFLPARQRAIAVAAACLVIGPKILLLMPGWLLGVWIHRHQRRFAYGEASSVLLMWGPPLLVLLGHVIPVQGEGEPTSLALWIFNLPQRWVGEPSFTEALKYSRGFLWLNIVSLLAGLHLIGAISTFRNRAFLPPRAAGAVKRAAQVTFSLYLLRHPIQLMLASMLFESPPGIVKTMAVFAGSIVLAGAIGLVIEPLKGRLRQRLDALFARRLRGAPQG